MSVSNHKAQKFSVQRRKELMADFLVAFEKTLGVVTPAAQMIGVKRSTIYRWREMYPEFDKACKEISEMAVDFVETKMFKKIEGGGKGSETLMIFYLKCKGKHRGYVEKQEIDMNAEVKGVTINVTSQETAQVLQDIMDKDKQ
jgi:hypothetical protein